MCDLSAENGDRSRAILIMATLKISTTGTIITASNTCQGISPRLIVPEFRMAKIITAIENPRTVEPLSPMKILADFPKLKT